MRLRLLPHLLGAALVGCGGGTGAALGAAPGEGSRDGLRVSLSDGADTGGIELGTP